MFPSPEFRLAVAYLLFLKGLIQLWLRNGHGDTPLEPLLAGAGRIFSRAECRCCLWRPCWLLLLYRNC